MSFVELKTDPFQDFDTTFTCFVLEGERSTCGIAFRIIDSRNFYWFEVYRSGYYELGQLNGSKWQTVIPKTMSSQIQNNQNTIHLQCNGNQLKAYINGNQVIDTGLIPSAPGSIGLAASSFEEQHTKVAFDDFSLNVLDVP